MEVLSTVQDSLPMLSGNRIVLEGKKEDVGKKWGPGMLSWLLLSQGSTWDGKRWNVGERPLHGSHDKRDGASTWVGMSFILEESKCSWAETL